MDIQVGIINDGIVVILPSQTKTDDTYNVISLNDYHYYQDELKKGVINDKIKINVLSKKDKLIFIRTVNDIADINMFLSFKTTIDLLNGFIDKGESYITHDFPNKNQLCLTLTTDSYFINNETVSIKHIQLCMGEYYQGDYGGTTSEGCHYMAYGGVYMKATDSLNASRLFQVSKFAGPTVSFRILNELFFNNELKFYSIEELANM